jgi:hypothetical protein
MAEETVVKEMLTQEMVQAGAELTRRLDKAHLEVCASFWLCMPDKNLWRLIVASPAVRQELTVRPFVWWFTRTGTQPRIKR